MNKLNYEKPVVEVRVFNLGNSNDSTICTSNTGTEDLGKSIYAGDNNESNGIYWKK